MTAHSVHTLAFALSLHHTVRCCNRLAERSSTDRALHHAGSDHGVQVAALIRSTNVAFAHAVREHLEKISCLCNCESKAQLSIRKNRFTIQSAALAAVFVMHDGTEEVALIHGENTDVSGKQQHAADQVQQIAKLREMIRPEPALAKEASALSTRLRSELPAERGHAAVTRGGIIRYLSTLASKHSAAVAAKAAAEARAAVAESASADLVSAVVQSAVSEAAAHVTEQYLQTAAAQTESELLNIGNEL
eukprot:SAG31_NODE_9040_length_1344_cov_1.102008_2_plen_247_part_01